MTPTTIAAICVRARAEVGVTEASGRNDGTRVEEYIALGTRAAREPGLSWCAAFVLWCHRAEGVDLPGNDWAMRRVSTLYEEARQRGAVLAAHEQPEPGDLVVWLGRHAHASAGPSGHVEIVVATGAMAHLSGHHAMSEATYAAVETIGGNVGNAVRRTLHAINDPRITAFLRPARMFGGSR